MARNSDYPQHVGSTDGGYALMAVDIGGGNYRLRWVHTETLGSQGPVGPAGVPGPNGPDGPQGGVGAAGAAGAAGVAGAAGAAGQSATILQPNIYLDDGFAVEIFEDYADGQSSGFNAGRGWDGAWQTSGSASIVTRTSHNGIIQKRLSLTSGEIGRTFRFGSIWNKIQVGILARINSAVAVPAMNYYAGVCSGTTNMASSATTDNFIGIAGSIAGTITWATQTFTQQDSLVSSATVALTRRGNVNTLVGNSTGLVLPSTEATLGEIWFQFIRPPFANDAASVTYNHRWRGVASGSVRAGQSLMKEGFINSLHCSLGDVDSYVGGAGSTFTPAFDQSTGPLDTFNFFWDSTTPIEIAGVAIRKVF